MNQAKIKDGYQSERKVVTHNSKSDLPLVHCCCEAEATRRDATLPGELRDFQLALAKTAEFVLPNEKVFFTH